MAQRDLCVIPRWHCRKYPPRKARLEFGTWNRSIGRARALAHRKSSRSGGLSDQGPDIPPGARIEGKDAMVYTIAAVLLLLWAVGLVTSYTMGGFIHVLLVIAIVVILLRVISGRAVV